jgi:hypothetical protein
VLPETGRYEVVIPAGRTGTMTLRIVLRQDVAGTITPDGPPETLTVSVPGQLAHLDFD